MVSEKVDFLTTVSLFSHLKEEELQRLASQSHYCSFKWEKRDTVAKNAALPEAIAFPPYRTSLSL